MVQPIAFGSVAEWEAIGAAKDIPVNSNVGNANANNGAFNALANNEWSNANGVRIYDASAIRKKDCMFSAERRFAYRA